MADFSRELPAFFRPGRFGSTGQHAVVGGPMRALILLFLLGPAAVSSESVSGTEAVDRPAYEKHIAPLPLRKLIDAAVLMLEAQAYEQFTRAFLSENDRGRFEKAYTRAGGVDYAAWGAQKAGPLLTRLRGLSEAEAVVSPVQVCFFLPGETLPLLSFVQVRGMWLLENSSRCAERKPARPPAAP